MSLLVEDPCFQKTLTESYSSNSIPKLSLINIIAKLPYRSLIGLLKSDWSQFPTAYCCMFAGSFAPIREFVYGMASG